MAMQFNVVLRRIGQFGTGGFGLCGVRILRFLLGAQPGCRLLLRQPAVMDLDLTAMGHGDIDAPAVGLGCFGIVP